MGMNGGQKISGSQRSGTAYRLHDHAMAVQTDPEYINSTWHASNPNTTGMDEISRIPFRPGRAKKAARGPRNQQCSARLFVAIILSAVVLMILGSDYIFAISKVFLSYGEPHESTKSEDDLHYPDQFGYRVRMNSKREASSQSGVKNILDNVLATGDVNAFRGLHFGEALVGNRDSRDWDYDDRNREMTTIDTGDDLLQHLKNPDKEETTKLVKKENVLIDLGLFNERGRKELRMYEKKFEADLENEVDSSSTNYKEDNDVLVEDVDREENLEKDLDKDFGDFENVDRKTSTFLSSLVDVDTLNFKANTHQNSNTGENERDKLVTGT